MTALKIFFTLFLTCALVSADVPQCPDIISHFPDSQCNNYVLLTEFEPIFNSRWYSGSIFGKSSLDNSEFILITEIKDHSEVVFLQESEKLAATISKDLIAIPKKSQVAGKWYIRSIPNRSFYTEEKRQRMNDKGAWNTMSIITEMGIAIIDFLDYVHTKNYLVPDVEYSDFISDRQKDQKRVILFHPVEKLVKFGTPFDPQSDFKKWDPARFNPAFSAPYDAADQIYKFGLVLAQLSCPNCPLFPGDDLETFKSNVAKGDYTLPMEIPVEFMAIIHWALMADRQKRITINELSSLIRQTNGLQITYSNGEQKLNNKKPFPAEILKKSNKQFFDIYTNSIDTPTDSFDSASDSPSDAETSSKLALYIAGGFLISIATIIALWMCCKKKTPADPPQLENPNNAPLTTNDISAITASEFKSPQTNIEIKN